MTLRAIGAASPLPEISPRGTDGSSISTATATWGSSAGANEMNQAYGAWSTPRCAVPVLPATLIPGICAVPAVPWSTTSIIIWVRSRATEEETALLRNASGRVLSRRDRSGACTSSTR